MCGIMGYIGPQQAAPILVDGLRRLEYRGYDSAGIAVKNHEAIEVRKAEGKLANLEQLLGGDPVAGTSGIGHTRWATHGAPSDANAHPHTDPHGEFVVVHNGIIENFHALKEELVAEGNAFASETDSEILAHLVAKEYDGDIVEATRRAVARAEGAYALVVLTVHEPDRMVAVRRISPLVIGLGAGETFLASDVAAVLEHTREFLIIEDGELVIIEAGGARIETIEGTPVVREPMHVDWDAGQAEKAGYPHFMLKEIFQQPAVITETLGGRLEDDGSIHLDTIGFDDEFARSLDQVFITACGTALHAGLVAKEVFRSLLRLPSSVEWAHELRYAEPLFPSGPSLTVAISQSGETADTLAAARLAKENGSRLLAITNVVGSTLAREADDILYTRAGPEIAVASTKAYTGMLIGEYLLAMRLGVARGSIDAATADVMGSELLHLPNQVEEALKHEADVAEVAARIADAEDMYFIGRGLDYAVAMEGSLKLKEISYLHSEAMPAGELKHGTLALVTEGVPVVVVLTQQAVYDKTISAVQEVKARGGHV
ncbi:MAG: glutamine--fructose-6-phosphate transaminase (isomerizing), partial [Acidimicrobiia bacterium]|nr:glutamine--fructose-6-phosphate transaminase (isomerizing) [Acidimicrobiia bacterium]